MKNGRFKIIQPPDLPAQWLHYNVIVRGYYGEVELPTDQYILRPMESIFEEALQRTRHLGNGEAEIVAARAEDEYGSIRFKFKYWGVPER